MAIYRKKVIWCRGSSLGRAGCFRMKAFHGSGEPDAGLGELRPRNIQKMAILPSFFVVFILRFDNQTST